MDRAGTHRHWPSSGSDPWKIRSFFGNRVDAKMILYLIGAVMLELNLLLLPCTT